MTLIQRALRVLPEPVVWHLRRVGLHIVSTPEEEATIMAAIRASNEKNEA